MMHKFLKIYLFIVILLSDFIMFADDPGTGMEDETGNTGGSVEEVPVNGWVIHTTVLAVAFAFYYFKNRKSVTE